MSHPHAGRRPLATLACALLVLAGCGGGSSDNDGGNTENRPPEPVITSPADGATFRAGDRIEFRASASDPEDGELADDRLVWWAELHHDTHSHPFKPETTGGSG